MSAIGSYEVLTRDGFVKCLDAARDVHPETTGKWVFKTTKVQGREAFDAAWSAARIDEVGFDYSGYVLGNYLDAQFAINNLRLFDEESEQALALANVFTAAFVFDTPRTLPELPTDKLQAFCREEYGEDGEDLLEPIQSAHAFYAQGIAAITAANLVVFIIR
jgi:hypothetical protein